MLVGSIRKSWWSAGALAAHVSNRHSLIAANADAAWTKWARHGPGAEGPLALILREISLLQTGRK